MNIYNEINCNEKEIKDGLYRSLHIKSVSLINTKVIGTCAFYDNEIVNLTLPNTIKMIKEYAFYRNNLKEVILPDGIELLEDYAFDSSVIIKYKNRSFNRKLIDEYGLSNILVISKVLDIIHNISIENFNLFFPKDILEIIPINNDSLKSYIVNRKKYHSILKAIYSEEEINKYNVSLFKMFYVFGFFSLNIQDEIVKIIKKFTKLYSIDTVDDIFKNVDLNNIVPKLSHLILENYSNPLIPQLIVNYYNKFRQLTDIIKKKKKELLRKKRVKLIREKESHNDIKRLEIEYAKELKNIRKLTLSDIIEYINESNFNIKNKELSSITVLLSSYLKNDEFENLEKLYQESLKIDDEVYFKNISEERISNSNKYYSFLSNKNPTNIILGYLCDCCAKYGDEGEDILRQSMINPCVKNLVIYSGIRKIVAKSTCYYNLSSKTIIFNNIEVSKSFMAKSSKEDKKEVVWAFLRALVEEVKIMEKSGIKVNEVRMEMYFNKLKDILLENYNVSYDRIPNYEYENCSFSKSKDGQLVLYKR